MLKVELFVEDVANVLAFYVDLLGFRVYYTSEKDKYVGLRRGSDIVGVKDRSTLPADHYFPPSAWAQPNGIGLEMAIETPDVDAIYRRVQERGYPVLTPLGRRPWGLRDFRLADPAGFYVCVTDVWDYEKNEPARR